MLNIGKLRKGGELYYLNSVARGVEDYYTGSGEAPGYWMAAGSSELGVAGAVGEDQLRAVLNGFHPGTGERLTNGKPTKRERVPGFDLTFRAPKSVSLLHALGGKEASNEVVSAHDAAVRAALGYLERHASSARRGKGGKRRISSSGFIGAAFRHRSSRAGDPLLHTHVLVANLIRGADGRWGALDARQLYVHAKTAGYLYQAQLRMELTRRLGVEWTPVRNGAADLVGVPRTVIRAFSRRRAEIEAEVGETKGAGARELQTAALTTRKAKDYDITPGALAKEWRERAERLGMDEHSWATITARGTCRSLAPREVAEIVRELAGPDGLTAQTSSFYRRDAIQGFCNKLEGGGRVEDIEAMTDSFLRSQHAVALGRGSVEGSAVANTSSAGPPTVHDPAEEPRFSTPEMLAVERAVIDLALERHSDPCGSCPPPYVDASLARRPTLYPDQQEMVRRLTTSGHGLEVVVGRAGAGKTFALDAAREAWETAGHRVIGCSLSARAAEELEFGSGISSCTIIGLLQDLDHPDRGGLGRDSILVVDEAGMVGTRTLKRLLEHARAANAKVVLVGDDRQLPEIDSGGAFRGIKERVAPIELTEVRRQPQGWERAALELIREGDAEHAVETYVANDRVVLTTSAEETRRQLIADWWKTRHDSEPAVMLAARRSDVADLNRRARVLMKASGALDRLELELDGTPFAVGDHVMTLKNNRRLGVKNGTRGTLEQIDHEGGAVSVRCDDGRLVVLPQSYVAAGHLTHAYAITGHKAQGMTTNKALVLGDQTLYREWTYVAMSRGKNENRLYVVGGVDPDRDELGGEVSGVEDPMKELVAAVARSRAKELALESYEPHPVGDVDVWERAIGP